MKKLHLIILLSVILVHFSFGQKLVILHTNDMHSKITGFGPESDYTPMSVNDDKTFGGFARLATIIANEKSKNKDAVLVCDAGDFLMGTIFQALEPETGFQLNLMKEMGFDVITIGNHEFDFGPNKLGDVINSALKNGSIPQIVQSQMIFSETDTDDDKLAKLVADKIIKPYTIIEKNGLKIGVFGSIGYDAQHVAPNAKPVTFKDTYKTAKIITKILKEDEKVDIVICLSHGGFKPNKNGEMEGEDLILAKKVPNIDIIISGHTHVKTEKYLQVGKTIIVQTGAYLKNVGRLELNYENGKLSVVDFHLIPVDDKIKGDKKVNQKIKEQTIKINNKILKPYGLDYSTPIAEANFNIIRGSSITGKPGSMGNFVSDAIRYYTNEYSTGTDIVLVGEGIVRENIYPGVLTVADIYRITPLGRGKNDILGYSLAQIYITGNEVKKLLELAIFAGKPGEDSYLYFSGVEADYNPKGGFLNKVKAVYINGEKINISKKDKTLYSLTANTYLLSFVGEVKKMSKGLIKIYPKDSKGNRITDIPKYLLDFDKKKTGVQEGKEWLAIIEFLKTFEDTDGNKLPNIPDNYKTFKSTFIEK